MPFFLFPGQGSQTPGMGRDFYEGSQTARTVLDRAAGLCGPGFLDSVFEGSANTLKDTRLAQVALVAVEAAIAAHLATSGHGADGCAGHSVGEIAALTAAESLALEDAIPLTQTRARLMSEDVPEGGMAAVIGLAADAIERVLPDGAYVANFNGPGQTVVSGTRAALDEARERLEKAGARRVIALHVSGPFHSPYMAKAAEAFRDWLKDVPFRRPVVTVVSSVTGKAVSGPDAIRNLLADQLQSPVRWTDVMAAIGPKKAVEVGPGRVLQGLAKRMSGAPDVAVAGTLEAADGLGRET